MKKLILISLILYFSFVIEAQEYKVIVNKANPVTQLTKKQISNYFLKKYRKWPNKNNVIPVDLSSKSSIRAAFSKDIHKKSTAQVRAFWQQSIFAGKSTPPRELADDSAVISYVKKYKGAIGYVSLKANTNGVKVITIK